jgi:hypothetical protein
MPGWDADAGIAGSPDQLRTDERAVQFIQRIFSAGKPVGVICHGPWTLVEADLVRGRKLMCSRAGRLIGAARIGPQVVACDGVCARAAAPAHGSKLAFPTLAREGIGIAQFLEQR